MLAKWIRCTVVDRDEFGRGQQAWDVLRGVHGFDGQRGGWDRDDPNVAHVVAHWADPVSYAAFMTGSHDSLAERQAPSYTGIRVRTFERGQAIGHPPQRVRGGETLRLAHCVVHVQRVEHFVEAQRSVWNPGMTETAGFRGGIFAQRGESEFLVVTQWESATAHDAYRREVFPALRDRAEPVRDLASITGCLVELDPAWYVPG